MAEVEPTAMTILSYLCSVQQRNWGTGMTSTNGMYILFLLPSALRVSTSSKRSDMTRSTAFPRTK